MMVYAFKVVVVERGRWRSPHDSAFVVEYKANGRTEAPRAPLRWGFGLTVWTNYYVARDYYDRLEELGAIPRLLLVESRDPEDLLNKPRFGIPRGEMLGMTRSAFMRRVREIVWRQNRVPILGKLQMNTLAAEDWPGSMAMVRALTVLDVVAVQPKAERKTE